MMRSAAFAAVWVTVTAVAAFTGGCGGKSELELGPKPAVYSGEKAHQSQLVDEMRAWLQTLGPEEAKALRETGEVAFRHEELKESDPLHAGMIEAYRKEAEARVAERMKARGELTPVFAVESVAFIRHERDANGKRVQGFYEFRIDLADGGVLTNIPLSDPL